MRSRVLSNFRAHSEKQTNEKKLPRRQKVTMTRSYLVLSNFCGHNTEELFIQLLLGDVITTLKLYVLQRDHNIESLR